MKTQDLVLVDGVRTPMAEYNGSFAEISAIDLGAHAARALFERTGIAPAEIDQTFVGSALQTSTDAFRAPPRVPPRAGRRRGAPAPPSTPLCAPAIKWVFGGPGGVWGGEP